LAGIDLLSLMQNHHFAARSQGHIRQREAWDMFERIRDLGFTSRPVAMSMVDQGPTSALNAAPPCRTPWLALDTHGT
jgi:hypothetical protein